MARNCFVKERYRIGWFVYGGVVQGRGSRGGRQRRIGERNLKRVG